MRMKHLVSRVLAGATALATVGVGVVTSPSVGHADPTPLPPPVLVFDNPMGVNFYPNTKYTGDSGYLLYTKDATVYRFDVSADQNEVLGSGYLLYASVDGGRVLIRRGSSLVVWQSSGDLVLPSPPDCDFGGRLTRASENMRFVLVSCPNSWVLVDVDAQEYAVLDDLGSQIVRVGNDGSVYYFGYESPSSAGGLYRRSASGRITRIYNGRIGDVVSEYGGAFVVQETNYFRSFVITETGESRPFAAAFQPWYQRFNPPYETGRYTSPEPIGDFLVRPDGTGSQCFGLAGPDPEGTIECFFGDHATGQGQYFVDAELVSAASLDERWDWRAVNGGKIEVRALPSRVLPSDRRCFSVQGTAGGAAIVNLTPVLSTGAGDGQLVSSDVKNPPVASNVNYRPGSIDPNVAVAAIGADGRVCFVNAVHASVHLVADHLGTISGSVYAPASSSGAPVRTVDTRMGLRGGRVGPSGRVCFAVAGSPGDAAVVNLTPVRADAVGDGQLASSDVASAPVASNVNYRPDSIDPNVAVAAIGADGEVCFVNSVHASVDLVADHLGTIAADAYVAASASRSGAPVRTVDTRRGLGGGKVAPSGRVCFSVSGNPGDAALVNLTPVQAEGIGDGQLVSSDVTDPPVASNVNYRPGSIDPNVAIAPIGADGRVCFVNAVHTSVHLVADHLGTIAKSAYSPATRSGAPKRVVDTRVK